jgi:hypothetical protein
MAPSGISVLPTNAPLRFLTLPICAFRKKILDDSGCRQRMEICVRDHSDADFTHGIRPECIKKHFPGLKRT